MDRKPLHTPTNLWNRQSTKTAFLFSLLSLFFLACEDDNEGPSLPDLNTYLERFEEEARLRGYDFDLSDVEAVYVDEIKEGDDTFCGYGYQNYDGNGLRRVEISLADNCHWAELNEVEREILFFHEIGHAFFNRGHEDGWLCDGSPLSIMTSSFWGLYTEGETEKRAYYISELIDKIAAEDQCIDYQRSWVNDSVFFEYTAEDDSWVFDSQDGSYLGARSSAGAPNGETISIQLAPGTTTDESGRWYRLIYHPNIPDCAEITLKVTMNSEQLTGTGAAISIRAFHAPVGKEGAQTEEYLYVTTTDAPVAGKLENYEEELTIPCYQRNTTFIVLFLRLMKGTEGKVTFEDIRLVVNE